MLHLILYLKKSVNSTFGYPYADCFMVLFLDNCVIWKRLLVGMSECVIALLSSWIFSTSERQPVKRLYRQVHFYFSVLHPENICTFALPVEFFQVSLAQMEYQLPRLTRMWTHLERQAGGQVKGMGEKQIEVDKRILRTQVSNFSYDHKLCTTVLVSNFTLN